MEPARASPLLQLVFRGECLDGHDPQDVRRAVADALKLDKKRTARLFSGQRIVLRREVDVLSARRHIKRFAAMGAVLRAEPSKPRPAPRPLPPAGPRRTPWPALQWMGSGALSVVVVALLGPLLGSWLSAPPPPTPAPAAVAPAAPERPLMAMPALPAATMTTAAGLSDDDAVPQDMTPQALDDYKQRYLQAPDHKAFVISSGGTHAWQAGAPSEDDARDRAMSRCMAALRPGDTGCRVVDADGQWLE